MLDDQASKKAMRTRLMKKVGVVDVGSNSVRLVVFDGVSRAPAYFFNEKVLCGLGAGLQTSGILNPEGRKMAMIALKRFSRLLRLMNVETVQCVATAAVRDATDGPEFCAEVEQSTGLVLDVATGPREAQLSAQGVLLGWPRADGIVCDIGGASMELASIRGGVIGDCLTSPLGPLLLESLSGKDLEAEIKARVRKLVKAIGTGPRKLYLVGGSWRALARIDMERRSYPLKVLHEYRMTPENLTETANWVMDQTPEVLQPLTGSSQARLSLVPIAARVMTRLLTELQPASISVSSYGIREGVLYEAMSEKLIKKDPLLEATRQIESGEARAPGFGDQLFEWLTPLLSQTPKGELRLVHAACRLHDITWRAHPDYRAEMCFETVTRANLSGLDHEGRVFLGLALANRYKSASHGWSFPSEILGLLSAERVSQAEALGKAMRLGAMISGGARNILDKAPIEARDGTLILTLHDTASELGGDAITKRLQSLASRLDLQAELVLKPQDLGSTR